MAKASVARNRPIPWGDPGTVVTVRIAIPTPRVHRSERVRVATFRVLTALDKKWNKGVQILNISAGFLYTTPIVRDDGLGSSSVMGLKNGGVRHVPNATQTPPPAAGILMYHEGPEDGHGITAVFDRVFREIDPPLGGGLLMRRRHVITVRIAVPTPRVDRPDQVRVAYRRLRNRLDKSWNKGVEILKVEDLKNGGERHVPAAGPRRAMV